jgi:hypothetical protein
LGYARQNISTTAGTERNGVLFPLSGRHTNSSTSTITICANVRRQTANDDVAFDTSAVGMTMVVTEIGR